MAWCPTRALVLRAPCPVAAASCSAPCSLVYVGLPPHVRPRAAEILWLCPSSVWWLSFLFSPRPRPLPLPSPPPSPRCQNDCRWSPRCRRRPRSRWMVCSRVSLSASLSQRILFRQLLVIFQPVLARLHTRYNCMTHGILLLQRAASSGIILRHSEPTTCQLHPTT
jgi:hypothetical protein